MQKNIENIFGNITPPAGTAGLASDPVGGLGKLIVFGIRTTLITAGIFLLVYLLWGGFDWISSGGDKERVSKARDKITQAIIGIIIITASLTIFQVVAGNILGIIEVKQGQGWIFELPTLK